MGYANLGSFLSLQQSRLRQQVPLRLTLCGFPPRTAPVSRNRFSYCVLALKINLQASLSTTTFTSTVPTSPGGFSVDQTAAQRRKRSPTPSPLPESPAHVVQRRGGFPKSVICEHLVCSYLAFSVALFWRKHNTQKDVILCGNFD